MRLFLFSIVVALAGCASQIMEGYVGKDVTEAMLDYGPPANVMDLPDGTRAFQWSMTSSGVIPTTTTYNATAYGNTVVGSTTTTGGGVYSQQCVYTLIGVKNTNKSYTITGYRKPTMMCD